jgi:oligopeptide/dipeptide ABC transporter ATP-binding protein
MKDKGMFVKSIAENEPLVRMIDIRKEYPGRTKGSTIPAVDGVSLEIYPSETLGLVGESGSGKTTLARMLIGLTKETSGQLFFKGVDIKTLTRGQQKVYRRHIQMVFQDPFSSLNPRMTVGHMLARPLQIHGVVTKALMGQRIDELLEMVGLRPEHVRRYPHELSGGQQQRVGIARALALDPELTILDEPTSALDVSVQAQILSLLRRLQGELNLTFLFISHDLSVIQYLSNRIAVMYKGQIMEIGDTSSIIQRARHPYTRLLLGAVPKFYVPTLSPVRDVPYVKEDVHTSGCPFFPRCTYNSKSCETQRPELISQKNGRQVACFHPLEGGMD